ncbi:MAG: hypothetical protein HYT73_03970 [Candidatus Aenigmarchaeota archaeon]|nr:hypothetical protein [Candidatus Aenigmarchaeota archaeon]
MNMLTFAVAIAIVTVSTVLLVTQINFLLEPAYNQFEEGRRSLENLDAEIRSLSAEPAGAKRLVQFSAGLGALSSSDAADTMEYRFPGHFVGSNFTQNNLNFSYDGDSLITVNYSGSVDIIGNASGSGRMSVSLSRSASGIQVEII